MENKKVLLRDVLKKFSGIEAVNLKMGDKDLGIFTKEEICKSPYYDCEVVVYREEVVAPTIEELNLRERKDIVSIPIIPQRLVTISLKYESFVIGKSTTIEVADNIFENMEEDRIGPFILWLIKENFNIDDEANLDKGVAYKFEKVPYSDYQKSEFFYHRQRGPELYHWRNKDYSKKEMEKIYEELKPYNIKITEYEV